MRGDFSRVTFDPARHYASVRMQQGRVQLDSDWNENEEIREHLELARSLDLLGECATPIAADGTADGFALTVDGASIRIGAGRSYVDGILCQNDESVRFEDQPDLPGAALPTTAGTYLFYLEVFDEHVTALEDPALLEPALGGPDTATRLRTLWQVRWTRVGNAGAEIACPAAGFGGPDVLQPTDATLAAFATSPDDTETCTVKPGARYQRLENQLYRVEVHDPGTLGTATFKWSRDNGSVATRLLEVDGDRLTVESLGPDRALGFAAGHWVEISDRTHELTGVPGTMVQVGRVEGSELVLAGGSATIDLADFDGEPIVRRWDSRFPLGQADFGADGSLPLEDGVRATLAGTRFNTGDYWLIPARTHLGDVIWPRTGTTPDALPPHGIVRHRCRLGLFSRGGGGTWAAVADCRTLFPPLTAMEQLVYLSGDGQEATPQPGLATLPLPVTPTVGVVRGRLPVDAAVVRFRIASGSGVLANGAAEMPVTTGADGIAACGWSLDPATPVQTVTATLLDPGGAPISLPITFSARLRTADVVSYVPGCDDLAEATTVQAAIDALCKRPSGGGAGCCATVGDGGEFKSVVEAISTLIDRGRGHICLCLLPGTHDLEFGGEIGGFESLSIGGTGPGSILQLGAFTPFQKLGHLAFRDLTILARSLDVAIGIRSCATVVFADAHVEMVEPNPGTVLVEMGGCETIRIDRSTLAIRLGGADAGPPIRADLPPEIRELLDLAERNPDPMEVRGFLVAILARPNERPIVVEGIRRTVERHAERLDLRSRQTLEAVATVLEREHVPTPTESAALVKRLSRLAGVLREHAGQEGRANALVLEDAAADTWIGASTLVGDLSLHGRGGRRDLRPHEGVIPLGRRGVGWKPDRGRLRITASTLDRIVLADEWTDRFEEAVNSVDPGPLVDLRPFAELSLSGSSLLSAPHILPAGALTLTANACSGHADGFLGTALVVSGTVVGNVGPGEALLFVGGTQVAEAANVGMNLIT